MKFSIKDFSSKCDHIYRKLRRNLSHLLEKSLTEILIFYIVDVADKWYAKILN